MSVLGLRLVPNELWALREPLIPRYPARRQGGGTAPLDDRAVFTAIVYVLTSGCAWRHLPAEFGVSPATAHRRFNVLEPRSRVAAAASGGAGRARPAGDGRLE
ncbi:transposase [Actinoallomurus sp. NPDC050550]|uniref:transposase n=1 Tax=Actinoallomurus sp. NPDC050550 TaxID=3154937 RepID=UPI0033C0AD16